MANTGVFPCYENQFQINTGSSEAEKMSDIAECETFNASIDNGIEEWTPMNTEGWARKLMTAKSVIITITAKRCIGDTGNDAVAALAWKNGRAVEKDFQWTFPNGDKIVFKDAVIAVTNNSSGDSTSVAPLEFEVHSNGKPTYTAAAA